MYIITLWLFNVAMENFPSIDDVPIKTSIYKGFSMAMLNIYICTIIHHIKPMQPATNSLSDFETPPGRSISTDGPGEMDSAQNSPMDAEAMEIPMG